MIYAVVTQIRDAYASAITLGVVRVSYHSTGRRLIAPVGSGGLDLLVPIFTLGEIIVLDGPGGRELTGAQRRPANWDVTVEEFETVEAAVERSLGFHEPEEARS